MRGQALAGVACRRRQKSMVARTTAFVVRVFSLGISSRSLAWHPRAGASGYDFVGHQAGEAEFHEAINDRRSASPNRMGSTITAKRPGPPFDFAHGPEPVEGQKAAVRATLPTLLLTKVPAPTF